MTPAKMFDGDLWVLASDAVAMAEKAYKNGQTDERNKVAQWMMDQGYATGHGDTVEDLLQELGTEIEAKIAAEREEIIQMMPGGSGVDPQWVCDAIRARGQA